MKRIELIQGSDKWLEHKHTKIGGTAASGLFVKSDTLLIDYVGRFSEDYEPDDSFQSAAMLRGTELEPLAIEALEKYTQLKFNSVGWLQCEEIEILGISPDGITDDDKFACEVKCFGRKKHTEIILSNEIPKENLHQLIHYFTVNPKLEKLYFGSFRPENKIKPLFVKELSRDSLVNLGTVARPKMVMISDAVLMAKEAAKQLEIEIEQSINNLKF